MNTRNQSRFLLSLGMFLFLIPHEPRLSNYFLIDKILHFKLQMHQECDSGQA